ncbi:MAG: hypothetical protein KKH94_01375 [Candidatus Omnitrophica bacterium]|nr:hypothetical protein [Candidatus Omnitrophota bacterium]
MDKKKIQIIVLAVGVVILLFVISGPKGKRQASRKDTAESSGNPVSQVFNNYDQYIRLLADKEIDDSLEQAIKEKLQEGWKRNPFELLVPTMFEVEEVVAAVVVAAVVLPDAPTFTVNGIIMDASGGSGSQIMIDGELYGVGDDVNGWKLISLEAERAVFKNSGVEFIYQRYNE